MPLKRPIRHRHNYSTLLPKQKEHVIEKECCCNEPNLYDICYHRQIASKMLKLTPVDPNLKIIEKKCEKGINDHVFRCEHKIKNFRTITA